MDNFFTAEFLGTFAGMAAGVTIVTQVIKRFLNIDAKWIALFASLLITVALQIIPSPVTADSLLLAAFNWLLVTGTSIGVFEGAKSTFGALMGKE